MMMMKATYHPPNPQSPSRRHGLSHEHAPCTCTRTQHTDHCDHTTGHPCGCSGLRPWPLIGSRRAGGVARLEYRALLLDYYDAADNRKTTSGQCRCVAAAAAMRCPLGVLRVGRCPPGQPTVACRGAWLKQAIAITAVVWW